MFFLCSNITGNQTLKNIFIVSKGCLKCCVNVTRIHRMLCK